MYDFGLSGPEDACELGDGLGTPRLLNTPSRERFQGVGFGGAGDSSEEGIPLNKSSSMFMAELFELRTSTAGLRADFEALELRGPVAAVPGGCGRTGWRCFRENTCCSLGADGNGGEGEGRTSESGFLKSPRFPHFPNSSGAGRNRFGLA